MDNTDSNQEADAHSSSEDISTSFDLRVEGSPTFQPLSSQLIERSPPEEVTEEDERESSESETHSSHETPRRRIDFKSPISLPPSPLPPFEEPDPPTMAAPSRAEFDALAADLVTLQNALTNALAAVGPPRGSCKANREVLCKTITGW